MAVNAHLDEHLEHFQRQLSVSDDAGGESEGLVESDTIVNDLRDIYARLSDHSDNFIDIASLYLLKESFIEGVAMAGRASCRLPNCGLGLALLGCTGFSDILARLGWSTDLIYDHRLLSLTLAQKHSENVSRGLNDSLEEAFLTLALLTCAGAGAVTYWAISPTLVP